MSVTVAPGATAEQRVVLHDVSWTTYLTLLAERGARRTPRMYYDRGVLELMSTGRQHEWVARLVAALTVVPSEEWDLDVLDLGGTTFRRAALRRGFEPDGCWFVRDRADDLRSWPEDDPETLPAPDLVLEVDISRSSMSKDALFAGFAIPEVWRYEHDRLAIRALHGDAYESVAASGVLPGLTAEWLTGALHDGRRMRTQDWLRVVRGQLAALRATG